MRFMAYILIMMALFILQSTVIAFLQIAGIKPDLPMVFALCISLYKGENIGSFMGFLNGFFEDIVYGRFLGFNALVKFFTNYVAGYATKNIFKGPALMTMVLVFLGSLLYNFIFIFVNIFVREINIPINFFVPVILPSALFNMIISPFIYRGVVRMERFFDYYFNIRY